MMFNLSVFDCMTDEERILYNTWKKAKKKDKDTAQKMYQKELDSFSGVRAIPTDKIFKDELPRLDKVIAGFENEVVRMCSDFVFDEDNPKKIPLVKEFIILDCSNETILEQIINNGIIIDKVEYFVYSSSTNQQKKKQVCLMQKQFFDEHKEKLMNSLTLNIINGKGGCNTGKYLAYISLVFSKSVEPAEAINIDEVLVLPEFETLVTDTVNYLDMDAQTIEEKTMPVPVNHMDGAGIFLPGLLPQSAQIRGGYIKGCVFPFDFRQFIIGQQENGRIKKDATVKDLWGKEYSIGWIKDHIKMILNGSQLKMYKYYNSWDEYKKAFKKNGLKICINNMMHYPKTDNPLVMSAYQFYQTVPRKNFTEKRIENLCKNTVNIINGYKTDNNAVLELFGIDDSEKLEPFYASIRQYPDMVYDISVRKKVKSKIETVRNKGMSGIL